MKSALYPLADNRPPSIGDLKPAGNYRPYLISWGSKGQVAIVGAIDPDNGVILCEVDGEGSDWMYAFNKVGHLLRFPIDEINDLTDLANLAA